MALGERFGGRLTALGVHNTDYSARCSGWCTDAVLMRLLMSAPKLACLEITGFTLRATSAALIEFVASRASGPLRPPPSCSVDPSFPVSPSTCSTAFAGRTHTCVLSSPEGVR